MKKYKWTIRNNDKDDWCVNILEKNITTDLIKEILEDAIKKNATDIYLDYCCLNNTSNPEDCWSEFENINETYKLVETYEEKFKISIKFVW